LRGGTIAGSDLPRFKTRIGVATRIKAFHCCLPLRGPVLCLRKPRNVAAGILKRDKLATAGQGNRIIKRSFPAAISHSATTG